MIENYGLPGETGAELSDCGRYRFLLWRVWAPALPPLGVVMLNPSTADASVNDPTITRVIKRAAKAHYGGIIVGNLYAWRATEPRRMFEDAANPVGNGNDAHLAMIGKLCPTVLCAWGTKGERSRATLVMEMLRNMTPPKPTLVHLGLTKDGHPKHPLYIPSDRRMEHWL